MSGMVGCLSMQGVGRISPIRQNGVQNVRNLYVILVIAVFGAYCYFATIRQNHFAVPESRIETVEIVHGASPDHFLSEPYASRRYAYFSALEKRHLHPTKLLELKNRDVQLHDVLNVRDFQELAESGVYQLEVRDPEAVLAFAGRGFILRQDLKTPEGVVLGTAGQHITKKMMEDAAEAQVPEVVVIGQGDVVGVNGTLIMVLLIFTAMVMVLKGVLWDPLCQLLDTREEELRAGQKYIRTNRDEQKKLEAEQLERHVEVRRAGHAVVAAARREGMIEAEKIMGVAREEAYRKRTHAEQALLEALADAEKVVRADMPTLLTTIRKSVTGS